MSQWIDSLKVLSNKYDICVLGEENCGKSSLILHYLHNKFIEGLDSSIEDLYTKPVSLGGIYHEITILDTTSLSDSYSTSRRTQILNTSTILFIYAINNHESFTAIEDTIERIQHIRPQLPPMVIVATKCDLEGQRQVSYEEGQEFAERAGAIAFVECSSLLGIGISEAFQPLVKYVVDRKIEEQKQDDKNQSQQVADASEIEETPEVVGQGKSSGNDILEQEKSNVNPTKSDGSNNTVGADKTLTNKSEGSDVKVRKINRDIPSQAKKEEIAKSGCCTII
ncbi:hypothetical protein G9P44_001561 [Scheffersomyces stipitis]|nr:hypothetical protein G9P44_001561 [Scheffersomyces stipitis]